MLWCYEISTSGSSVVSISAFSNRCHCGCCSCSPVCTVQVSLSEADITCNSVSVSFFSQLHVCSSFQPESRICVQSLVLKIIPQPGTKLLVPRNLFP